MKGSKPLFFAMLVAACLGLAVWLLTLNGVDSTHQAVTLAGPRQTPSNEPARERLEVSETSEHREETARAVLECERPPAAGKLPFDVKSTAVTAPSSIAGRVTTDGGLPLADVRIVLERDGTTRSGWAARVRNVTVVAGADHSLDAVSLRSDERGAYSFENVEAGSYSVNLFDRANEFGRRALAWSSSVELAPGETRENVDFILASAQTIVGRVLDPDGRGVEDAEVSVVRSPSKADRSRLRDPSQPRGLPLPVRTGTFGTFCLSGLASGDYMLHVKPPRLASSAERAYELAPADSPPIASGTTIARILLRRMSSVSGVVRAPDGSAWSHAGVIAKDANGSEIGVTYADADGRFSVAVAEDQDVDLIACPSWPLGGGREGWSMSVHASSPALRGRAGTEAVVLVLARSQ